MDIFLDDFTEEDCKNKVDKQKVAEMKEQYPTHKYVRAMLLKKKGIWICGYYPD